MRKQLEDLEKQEQQAKTESSNKRVARDSFDKEVHQVLGAQKCTVYDALTQERRERELERLGEMILPQMRILRNRMHVRFLEQRKVESLS